MDNKLRCFKEQCERHGLGEVWAKLSLVAIKRRQKAIELGDASQDFIKESEELLVLARAKGLDCPDKLDSDEVANLLA